MASQPPRLQRPDTFFHVMSQGTNQWNVFLDDQDKRRFLFILADACKRYDVRVHAFCLMGNHFHLLVYCRDLCLSDLIRDLKGRYAISFNQRRGRSGAVFNGPFVAKPVLDDDYLVTVVRYIHRNPLDLDPRACLASAPWSSHGIYLGLRPQPPWFETTIVRHLFGPGYRVRVETPQPGDKVQNIVRPIVTTPGAVTIEEPTEVSLAAIRREISVAAGCELADIRPRSHNGLNGLAALVSAEAGFSVAELAEPCGYRSRNAAHMAIKRTRQRLQSDNRLAHIHQQVTARLDRAA